MMRNLLLALFVAATCALAVPGARAGDGAEPVVLTVTGNVAKPNRGPIDAFEDAVFSHMDIKFDKAFTFTLSELKALPQKTIKVRYPDWPREVEASGPSIVDVLKAATAEGKKILVQAIDGYAPEFTGEDIAKDKMILALSADGKALGLGGRGPLWLLGPTDSFTGQEGEEGFAFAVVRIDVQ
jgi:hypothetical protein